MDLITASDSHDSNGGALFHFVPYTKYFGILTVGLLNIINPFMENPPCNAGL